MRLKDKVQQKVATNKTKLTRAVQNNKALYHGWKSTEPVRKNIRTNKKVYQACGVTALATAVGTLLVVTIGRHPENAGVKQVGIGNRNTVNIYLTTPEESVEYVPVAVPVVPDEDTVDVA